MFCSLLFIHLICSNYFLMLTHTLLDLIFNGRSHPTVPLCAMPCLVQFFFITGEASVSILAYKSWCLSDDFHRFGSDT